MFFKSNLRSPPYLPHGNGATQACAPGQGECPAVTSADCAAHWTACEPEGQECVRYYQITPEGWAPESMLRPARRGDHHPRERAGDAVRGGQRRGAGISAIAEGK